MSHPLTLPEVVQLFEAWRGQRLHRQDRIPDRLWKAASSLVGRHSPSEIIRHLHISYSQYQHKVLAQRTTKDTAALMPLVSPTVKPGAPTTFVNVTPWVAEMMSEAKPTPAVVSIPLKFLRKDGVSATCHCPNQSVLQDTLSWFLRAV